MSIIIIVILAGTVILGFGKNNPMEKASKAVFMNDIKEMQQELSISLASAQLKNLNNDFIEDLMITGKDVIKYIPSANKYVSKIAIIEGEIIYIGDNDSEMEWASEIGLMDPNAPVVMYYRNLNK